MVRVAIETRIDFSTHAIERYRDRVGSALDPETAQTQLFALAACAELGSRAPEWLMATAKQDAELYLMIGGDVVFPLASDKEGRRWIAKTCLARGTISAEARERRNAAKASKRRARRERA